MRRQSFTYYETSLPTLKSKAGDRSIMHLRELFLLEFLIDVYDTFMRLREH